MYELNIKSIVILTHLYCLLHLYRSLQQVLLQSEEELLAKRSAGLTSEGASVKPKKIIGKMKVQGTVRVISWICLCLLSISLHFP